jgi:hypothetical protein
MNNLLEITAAAARPRTLSTPTWPSMRGVAVGDRIPTTHNSIVPTTGVVSVAPVFAGRRAAGAAKRAAPPRGEPR